MRMPRHPCSFVPLLLLALLAACQRESSPAAADPQTTVAPVQAPDVVSLQDVVETTPDYIVGISFPQSAAKQPALAQALKTYAATARGDLMKAVAGLEGHKPTAPYDLSLQFTGLVDTPDILAVAADGSSYTGGAHGIPLVARFVWLPKTQKMLTAQALFTSANAWQVISDAAREQLSTTLSQRLDADDVEGAERAQQLQNGSRMIDDGTAPKAENFAQFEPVMDVSGRIRALRFVFPPYQVGPYVDGTRSVDIPARVLLPIMAPDYKTLFMGG
ncbi:MAG: PdaC/SigV domain-containing protein [Thermomonas sp.]